MNCTRLLRPRDFQATILEWVSISFSRGSSRPRDQTWAFRIAGRLYYPLSHQGIPEFSVTTLNSECIQSGISSLSCFICLFVSSVGLSWLSILSRTMCTCSSQTPNLSLCPALPAITITSFCKSLSLLPFCK